MTEFEDQEPDPPKSTPWHCLNCGCDNDEFAVSCQSCGALK